MNGHEVRSLYQGRKYQLHFTNWWLIIVTLVVSWWFLPQNFGRWQGPMNSSSFCSTSNALPTLCHTLVTCGFLSCLEILHSDWLVSWVLEGGIGRSPLFWSTHTHTQDRLHKSCSVKAVVWLKMQAAWLVVTIWGGGDTETPPIST